MLNMTDWINTNLRKVPAWLIYALGPVPGFWFLYLGLTGGLGAEPIKALEHELGEIALQLLVAVLAVTPLRRFTGLNLMKFRRAIGIMSFVYALGHFLVWLVLDVQILAEVWADILKRPYVTIGVAAFLLLIPLAVTSNNWSVRKMGPKWRVLHKLTYPAAILAAVHFIWLAKGFQLEPIIYLGVILGLLAVRPRKSPRRQAA